MIARSNKGESKGTPGSPTSETRCRESAFEGVPLTPAPVPGAARASLPVLDRHRPRGPAKRGSHRSRQRLLALIVVHVIVLGHIVHWKLTGNTLSPLEPSESMQTLELGYLNAGFILFVLLILLTMIFGRFFCGWACHLVAYQDACYWLLGKMGIRPRPVRSRLLVFVPFGAAFYMFLWPQFVRVFEGRSFPPLVSHLTTDAFWATFPGLWIGLLTLFIDGMLIIYFLGAKSFCTYGCPYGAIFSIADRITPGKIRVTDDCDQCGHCTSTCTSNVRVHEEVAKFKMVVDTGCMKCLDCVSVCPKHALYYGKAKPTLFSLRQIFRRKKKIYDYTWTEEILLVAAFLAGLYAFRGLYDAIPFLLTVGLSVLLAFCVVLAWRMLRQRQFAFQNHVLRNDGHLTRAGVVASMGLPLAFLFFAHSVFVQYHAREGTRHLEAAEHVQGNEREAHITTSLDHLQTASAWGLVSVGAIHLKIGSILRARGDAAGAESEMRKAIQAKADLKTPRLELARLLANRGAYAEAESELLGLLKIDPENEEAQRALEIVREFRR